MKRNPHTWFKKEFLNSPESLARKSIIFSFCFNILLVKLMLEIFRLFEWLWWIQLFYIRHSIDLEFHKRVLGQDQEHFRHSQQCSKFHSHSCNKLKESFWYRQVRKHNKGHLRTSSGGSNQASYTNFSDFIPAGKVFELDWPTFRIRRTKLHFYYRKVPSVSYAWLKKRNGLLSPKVIQYHKDCHWQSPKRNL